jgi:uncharacterized protein (TIGR00369 family)
LLYPPHKAPSSGAQELVGYHIDLSAPDGTARVTLDMRAEHLNRNLSLHGGIHAMLLDAAAGFAAARHLTGQSQELIPVVTLSLSTSFLGAALGEQVEVIGRVTGGGRKIIYAEAQMKGPEGVLLSSAAGVFRKTTPAIPL